MHQSTIRTRPDNQHEQSIATVGPSARRTRSDRGRRGNSAVEYAVFLGLLTSIVGGGAVCLGSSSNRSLSLLDARMTDQPVTASPTTNANSNAVSFRADGLCIEGKPDDRHRITAVPWVHLALGAVVIGFCCVLLIRQHDRCKQRPIPQDDSEVSDLQERLCTKRQHLLRLISRDPSILLGNQLAVRHLVTTDVITVPSNATRQCITKLMREAHVRHLPVCGPDQQLLGIVTDCDLNGKRGKTARELMSRELKTVSPDMLISPAITGLIQAGISSLPVVEDGRLCGILTATDVVLGLHCLLQLRLHTAKTMHSEAWEQEFMHTVQTRKVLTSHGPIDVPP